tara:strand:- start:15983 stop:16174 length:192 start_codon:yes stop_codon:yes gene_type:complete
MDFLSDALKVELKQLINEVLDEREHQKKLEGPYDFPEWDEDDKRMDVIGQNGNLGLHYDEIEI